jgi:hypothetical protein
VNARESLAFVRRHGIVLMAARGAVPSLAEAIAGGPIRGSWWAHPRGREMYRLFQAVSESPRVLVCRLVDGKVTFVHRRLWPALVRLAPRFPKGGLAEAREEHTARGRHRVVTIPFPRWVPADVLEEAKRLDPDRAATTLARAWPRCGS